MSGKIGLQMISRRRLLSLLGAAAMLGIAVPSWVLTTSHADAQTAGCNPALWGTGYWPHECQRPVRHAVAPCGPALWGTYWGPVCQNGHELSSRSKQCNPVLFGRYWRYKCD
jgi:hypothetical protein